MRPVLAPHKADPRHPFIDESSILAGAEVPPGIDPAWEDVVVDRAAPPIKPSQQARPSVWKKLELNRASCFLLHHDCPRSYLAAAHKVANLDLHQVTAPQLAVDRQVEQRSISQATPLVEVEADLPDLLRLKRALRADRPPGIPDLTLDGSGFCFRHLHDRSPTARLAV